MKIGLTKYFKQNCIKNTDLIGLQVITADDKKLFIVHFSEDEEKKMPTIVFVHKKQDSDYGKGISTDELYVEMEVSE